METETTSDELAWRWHDNVIYGLSFDRGELLAHRQGCGYETGQACHKTGLRALERSATRQIGIRVSPG